jgi:hypothetical protein
MTDSDLCDKSDEEFKIRMILSEYVMNDVIDGRDWISAVYSSSQQ